MSTHRERFNRRHGFPLRASHSIQEIARLTGYRSSVLQQAYNRGVGARRSNPSSVRLVKTGRKNYSKSLAGKMSANQWGMGRVYGLAMKNPKQVALGAPDHDLWRQLNGREKKSIRNRKKSKGRRK